MKTITKVKLTAVALFGLAVLSPYRDVDAAPTTTHASTCNPENSSSGAAGAGDLRYGQNGVFNNAAHPALVKVQCGSTSETRTVNDVIVHVFDRNSLDAVRCTATLYGNGHTFISQTSKQTGINENSPSSIPLSMMITGSNVTEITVYCEIPGTITSGYSFVSAYTVI